MSGAELRRFVGGPFPNLVPGAADGRQVGGMVGGPYANLVAASRPTGEATAEPARLDAAVTAISA